MTTPWKFLDSNGTFELENPHHSSYLYFPLVNEAGMMSCVTPLMHGDAKTGQHAFLTQPLSVEDLHNTRSARNFWVSIKDGGAWSATGSAAPQMAQRFAGQEDDQVTLRAGLLWHHISRSNHQYGLQAEITSIVPPSDDQVELMRVSLKNISDDPVEFTPTAAIPVYARSADNLRDHRHVTSLLHQINCQEYGILVHPTLSFDERGHQPNALTYTVIGTEGDGTSPEGFFPLVEDFIGEGGSFDWPEAAVRPLENFAEAGQSYVGYEAIGGLRFKAHRLSPGQSCTFVLIMAVVAEGQDITQLIQTYAGTEKFEHWLQKTQAHWRKKQANLDYQTHDPQFDHWLKWVSIQPTLRRLFGNSFLPFHDYGRGGRGWRDLWQDILALLIMETDPIDHLLFENFAGVRIDGSNATIIGNDPGDFKADRNNIPRVWMDHGAWPLLTVRLYIDQTGDLAFLLRNQVYFKDHLINRAQVQDSEWDPSQGTQQRTQDGGLYHGSILEHLLLQHLSAFFNVGEHNLIQLEGADWNDGMDMAPQRGESAAFSALYASNLRQLGHLVRELHQSGVEEVELAAELIPLLDRLKSEMDYDNIKTKQQRLQEYFASVSHTVSGSKVAVRLPDLEKDLLAKSQWLTAHIRDQEWISNHEGYGWFNGYYDNDGQRLEGDHPNGVRMTLTGQVFPLMGEAATDDQAEQMIRATDHYLFDPRVGGYRLNTDFREVLLNMGRCFGFAYGHKENGAMFSHMAVMYAYALYTRGYARQAFQVLDQIYRQSVDFETSRMYPGIPEYFNARGRGVYPYLTGAASWYLLTLLTQAYGVRGDLGDLLLAPQLVQTQFDSERQASVRTRFADRQLRVIYQNPDRLEYGDYQITRVQMGEKEFATDLPANVCRIPRKIIVDLAPNELHRLIVTLASKN